MTRPFVEHLKTRMADGETTLVLKILLNFFANSATSLSNKMADLMAESSSTLRDECILHQSALKKSDKDLQRGLITEDDHNQVASRVNYALLDLFSQVEMLDFDDDVALQKAELIENNQVNDENIIGNVKEIKKRGLMVKAAIGVGCVALLAALVWGFRDKFSTKKNLPVAPTPVAVEPKRTHTDSLLAARVHFDAAENYRSNNDFANAIKECQEAIKWDATNASTYNLLAECYLNSDKITPAFETIKKAYKCDSVDANGHIMSTLAQIYGEMGNTKLFYLYTEESLKRGLPVWEYETELGFKVYKDEAKFKALMKKHKK